MIGGINFVLLYLLGGSSAGTLLMQAVSLETIVAFCTTVLCIRLVPKSGTAPLIAGLSIMAAAGAGSVLRLRLNLSHSELLEWVLFLLYLSGVLLSSLGLCKLLLKTWSSD